MKYNSTYTPKLSFQQTMKAISEIRYFIIENIKQMYELIELTPPIFLEENDELLAFTNDITRKVSFDTGTEYKVATLQLSHTNWLRSMIDRLDIEYNKGVMSFGSFIWRDVEESPTNSVLREEVTFQIKVENNNDLQRTVKDISQKIYSFIYKQAQSIESYYAIENIYPEFASFISSQMMENEFPNETVKQRELDFAYENESYILESPGDRMYSGKVHSKIPSSLYDLKNFNQIVMRDRINNGVLKVCSISALASGDLLKDQLNLYGGEDLLTLNFYDKWSKIDYKVVEIKMNIPRLVMALLAKGHIAEVQAGVISDEAKVIKEKYGIETV